ncbi:MAG: hypothetical protein Q9225_005935 [Loekoesia sp. 1 TL-2023]
MSSSQELTGIVVNPLDFPLTSPPPGVDQNLAHPQSRTFQIYTVSAVFLALTISFLMVRLYAKLHIQRSRTWDDYACVAALIGTIAYIGVIIAAESEPSGGKHLWDTKIGDYSDKGFVEQVGTMNLASDFYLLFIPIPAVLSLQLPKSKKIGVIAMFMTGFLACIVSTVSLGLRIIYNKTLDISWNVVTLYIMTIVEMNVGLMVACMPSVATVFRHHGASISSFMGRISSKFRSFASRRHPSYTVSSKPFSPDSSEGTRSSRPRSETYIELRDARSGFHGDRNLAPGPIV